jgi:benzoylformate decarboxylase
VTPFANSKYKSFGETDMTLATRGHTDNLRGGPKRLMSVRDATYDLLRAYGMTTIFGNLGSTEEPFLQNFPSDFQYVLALQETSAVAMADGFAQSLRRPVLVNLHTAAGLGNAMGALLTAFENKTPLVITSGQQTREMLLMEPYLTNVDPTTLPRPFVKWAYEPVRAQDVPAAFMRAIATALQPPAGPVFLSLPLDDWNKPADGPAVVRTVSTRVAPDPERLSEFAEAIRHASKPVLIYGAAIARGNGWDEAVALAETLGAPVWVAPAPERAPFPEDHPLYRGILPFAKGPLSEHLEGHDLALVVGAPVFRYYPYVPGPYLPDGVRLLQISDDPAETSRAPVGDSLLGDATLSLARLKELLVNRAPRTGKTHMRHDHRNQHAPVPAPNGHHGDTPSATVQAANGSHGDRLSAAEVFAALSEIRPAHAILVEETPSNFADLKKAWPSTEPDTFYTFASGALGWGLPASVGVALAERSSGHNRPVIAVMGDGSSQYAIQSMWSAAQLRLPLLIVIMRNEEYAVLKSFAQLEQTPDLPGLDLPGMDFVSTARGYGCDGVRVEDLGAIKAEAAKAWTKDVPTVLEIPISRDVPSLI